MSGAVYAMSKYNAAVARQAVDGTPPRDSVMSRSADGADTLVRVCRENPAATYTTDGDGKRTMVQVLQDSAVTYRFISAGDIAKMKAAATADCK